MTLVFLWRGCRFAGAAAHELEGCSGYQSRRKWWQLSIPPTRVGHKSLPTKSQLQTQCHQHHSGINSKHNVSSRGMKWMWNVALHLAPGIWLIVYLFVCWCRKCRLSFVSNTPSRTHSRKCVDLRHSPCTSKIAPRSVGICVFRLRPWPSTAVKCNSTLTCTQDSSHLTSIPLQSCSTTGQRCSRLRLVPSHVE